MTSFRWWRPALLVLGAAVAVGGAWAGCAAGSASGGSGGAGGDDEGWGGSYDGGIVDAPHDTGPVDCATSSECTAFDGACTKGVCTNGKCATEPKNELGTCDDGLYCTENDTCQSGVCVGGTQRYCPSSDECHIGVCDEDADTCTNIPGNDGGQCDDKDPCTTDACVPEIAPPDLLT